MNPQEAWRQGQQQAELSRERYHCLCAAATEAYTIVESAPRGMPFARQALDFSSYAPYQLKTITGIKLHIPRSDGTINPGDIEYYVKGFRNNWKCREGGIMYCEGEEREFWNLIINFHSSPHTTGIEEWDDLLTKLKFDGPDPGIVPCMWFAREAGCLDPKCPFFHDETACIRDREDVLAARRAILDEPTTRDVMLRYKREVNKLWERSPQLRQQFLNGKKIPEEDRLRAEQRHIKRICSNPECLAVQWKATPSGQAQTDMKKCSRCNVTYYCSAGCQKQDWKRHKKEPCVPLEELVNNDDIWDEFGQRKGTGNPMFRSADDDN